MDVGVAVFAGSYGLAPPALGRAHPHPVASRRPDGRLVRTYAETEDPFVALSTVAAVTTTGGRHSGLRRGIVSLTAARLRSARLLI